MNQEQVFEMETEQIECVEKLRRAHHLLAVMENEFLDIKKVYLTAVKKEGDDKHSDYMTAYMDQFESLLGIASDVTKIDDTPTIK